MIALGTPEDFCSAKGSKTFEETGKVMDFILKTNNFKTCSNFKSQKDTGSTNSLKHLETFAKYKAECLLKWLIGCKFALVHALCKSKSYTVYTFKGRLKLDIYLLTLTSWHFSLQTNEKHNFLFIFCFFLVMRTETISKT